MNAPPVGQVIRIVSGTRPISATVVAVGPAGITLRCGADWTYQGGSEVTVDADKFGGTLWAHNHEEQSK